MEENNPLISVIVPVFNRKVFIKEAIQSLLQQSDPQWELIIVDDGSTDGTQSIVNSYSESDNRIKLIERNRGPKGATTCRNIGLERANSSHLFFLDSDDLIAKYCIEQRIQAIIQFPGYDYYVFSMILFNKEIGDLRLLTNISTTENDFYRFLRSDIVWSVSCPLWKRDALLALGGFDETFPNCQDHDLHLRALYSGLKYKKLMDLKPDSFYRQHTSDKIYEPGNNKKILVGVEKLIFKTNEYFTKDNKGFSPELFLKNLGVTLIFAIRRYAVSGLFNEAKTLLNKAYKEGILSKKDYLLLKLYLFLQSLGKIKGYERVWNILLSKYKRNTLWAKYKYEGELN